MPELEINPVAATETGDVDLSSNLSVKHDAQIGMAREARFFMDERERTDARRAPQNGAPRRVLSAEERAQVAAENASYIPLTKRVPAHGVRGWPAASPSRGDTPNREV